MLQTKQVDYYISTIKYEDDHDLTMQLNRIGESGWELVNIDFSGSLYKEAKCIFKSVYYVEY